MNLETVRYYERRGLLPKPPRTASGYRLFPIETTQRLRFIQRAKELGFSLKEIGELLSLRVSPTTNVARLRNAPFSRALTGRAYESMEARPIGTTRCWRFAASETSLSLVLARIRRFAEFGWPWLSRIGCLPASSDRWAPSDCIGSDGIQSEQPSWVWPVSARIACSNCCPFREVYMGIRSDHVRCGRTVGYRFAVECVADSRSIQPSGHLRSLRIRKS